MSMQSQVGVGAVRQPVSSAKGVPIAAKSMKPDLAAEANTTQGHILWEEIVHAMNYRRTYAGRLIQDWIEIRDIYNGDLIVPLPGVKGEPDSRPAIPALMNDAIDGLARRAGSLYPMIYSPALDRTKDHGKKSRDYAETRERALYANWHFSGMREVLIRKAFRQYAGYGTWAYQVTPDFNYKRARVELRDPLTCYPDLRIVDVIDTPKNVGYMYARSRAWVINRFGRDRPEIIGALEKALKYSDRDSSDIFDVVEWVDENDIVVGVLGPRYQSYNTAYPQWPIGGFELRRWPNLAGIVPASIPYKVTLDRIMGQVNLIVPIVNMMAKFQLLDYFAAEKLIWPDLVIMGKESSPVLQGGRWKDGRSGDVNIIEQADQAKLLTGAPGPMSQQTIDQLERAARITSGNPAMFGGEATGNIRSGQTVSQLGSYSVDPYTQEAQELMGRSLAVVNKAIMAVEKGYWGNRKFVVFSGKQSDQGMVEYTPNDHYETDENVVAYPFAGTDLPGITVAVGQLVGTGLASKQTGRIMHPAVEDPIREGQLVMEERLDDAMLAGILVQAQQGQLPVIDMANIRAGISTGNRLDEAIISADSKARERQASVPQPPTDEQGQPTGGPPPESMPGLAPPGQGAESQPAPQIQPPGQDLMDLKGLFRALRAR